MYRLEDCIAFLTKKVSKELSDNLENRFKPFGISRTQWMILYYVKLNKKINQKILSYLLSIKESSIVRQLDKMEEYGWVNRFQSEIDKRVKIVGLTDLGEEVEKKMTPIV